MKKRIDADINGENIEGQYKDYSRPKMLIISGHETTISLHEVFLMDSLGFNDSFFIFPKFAAQIAFEVTRKNDGPKKNYSDYFDEYLLPKKKSKYSLSFPLLWQKFVITFTSLLSIICLTWITYNWKTTNGDNSIPEIKGEKTFFKVLPDAPNIVSSAYNNKTVYERVDPNIQTKRYNERLMTSTEEPGELPISDNFDNSNFDGRSPIQNYTIIDDRDYYVKCKKNNDVLMTRQQVATIRKKLSSYSNSAVLSNVSCSIRKVANTQGQLGEYILIGPFCNEVTARDVGKFCQINNGEIISVQKK